MNEQLTPKQYLHQAYMLNELIDSNINELTMLQARIDGLSAVDYSRDHVSGTGIPHSPLESAILKIEAMQAEINREIDQYIDLKHEIHQAINQMQGEERLILRLRYIEFRQWDDIQTIMNKERTRVFSIHQQALNNFKVPEKHTSVKFSKTNRTKPD